jgi:hypothetical protein
MLSSLSKITCPYCFETFEANKVKFRCVNPKCAKRGPDEQYARARGLQPLIMGHVYESRDNSWRIKLLQFRLSARCDSCSKESSKRLCPHCHFELSHDAGLIDDYKIAIIGGSDTGKGHYIATLIHKLEHEIGTQFKFGLRMLGDETRERFENDYRTPLFRRKSVLQPTRSSTIDTKVKQPMIFRFTIESSGRRRAVNLSFFDSAGEDMQSLDIMDTEARYICFASGIIFLLDPLQIETVRQKLPKDFLPQPQPLAEPIYIVERLRELFERQYGLPATAKVRTPVAFVLSKTDALWPIIDASSSLRYPGEHFGYFNLSDAQSVHTEIWSYLQSWMGGGFASRVETNFANYRYFGVSSLGHAPDKQGKIDTVSPVRVEDPFLWILYRLRLVRGRKDR